jgi:hypothetical protein
LHFLTNGRHGITRFEFEKLSKEHERYVGRTWQYQVVLMILESMPVSHLRACE